MEFDGEWLTADDSAAYLREKHRKRCTSGYLAKLRHIGGGPTFTAGTAESLIAMMT